MKKLLVGLVLCGVAWAGEFQTVKLVDIQPFSVANNSMLGRWAASDGGSAVIPATRRILNFTVQAGDISYSANFAPSKHLAPADFIIGDQISVRIDGDKMWIKTADGKEARGYIVRRTRVTASEPASPQPTSH